MFLLLDITPYSFISGVFVTSVFILFFIVIFARSAILSKIKTKFIIFIIIAINLRLLFPIEFLFMSESIDSYHFLAEINSFLNKNFYVKIGNIIHFGFKNWYIVYSIWFLCSAVLIFARWRKYSFLCKKVKYIPPTNDKRILDFVSQIKKAHNLKFDVIVIKDNNIKIPSEFGYFRKIIFIDGFDYSDKDLYYILFHELMHFKIKSNWIRLFSRIVKLILWWNPIVILFQNYVDYLLELFVDSYVTNNLNESSKADYLTCILNVYKSAGDTKISIQSHINSLVIVSEQKALKNRFYIIAKRKRKSIMNLVINTLLFLSFIIYIYISFRFVFQPAYVPKPYDLYTPIFTKENSYIIEENGRYKLYYYGENYMSSKNIELLPDVPIIDK